ncbi:integrase core domain-containing protein [Deinococcus sp. YIM 77859]|uniref:integrase core domain-containing protein n=1 Tax=Deinococcus sp. YIM 77859 TaxID=1540221 RepID=UPI00068D6E74|nr:integrase core domain-containing protein [Deinococcus sp. YIM 77859]
MQGRGILERTHWTFNYEFVFREDFASLMELQAGVTTFYTWYNYVRLHSALSYAYPWAKLLGTAKSRNAA